MEIPQQNPEGSSRFLAELNRKVDELSNAMRFNNLQDSPTVRVVKTAVGTTLHSTPPTPTVTPTTDPGDARYS